MKEAKLKKIISYFLLFAKVATLIIILLAWQINAFTKMEMFGTLTLILPLFTVYTSIIFKQTVQNRYELTEKVASKKLTSVFRTSAFFVLPIYVLMIIGIIYGKAVHIFKYEEMQAVIGLVEAGFGVYVGQIVLALFKKEE